MRNFSGQLDQALCSICQKLCGAKSVTDIRDEVIEQIPDFIWVVGEGRGRGETYDRMLDRAARKTGINASRLWAYWYRKVRKPLADEYLLLQREWAALKADAKTIELMAELRRSQGDVADATTSIIGAAFPASTDDLQRDRGDLFSDSVGVR